MSKVSEPPWSQEAEEAVLGAILLRPAVLDEVSTILRVEDFYRGSYGLIYQAMLNLYHYSEPVDLVTVTQLLKERGKLAEVGGPSLLADLSDHVGTAANAPYYAGIVRKKAMLRRLLAASQEIAAACMERVDDVDAFIDRAEDKIFQIKEQQDALVAYSLEDLVPEERARIEKIFESKREILGLPSGFTDLDRLTGGFQGGDLILLAARPSMGKTAMALNMGFHAAKVAQVPTLFFSMEQPKEQLVQRLMANAGQINAWRLRAARMETDEWKMLYGIEEKFEGISFFIIDQPALNPLEIRAHARRLKSKHGIGLIILDYLQMAKDSKAKNREQEIGGISRSLKALGKELSIPVIALSQLNRDLEKRPNKQPILSDLRESGSLEQDADLVIFIYRDEVYNENTKDKGLAEIHLAKQRNGPVGRIKLVYRKEFMQFANYEGEE